MIFIILMNAYSWTLLNHFKLMCYNKVGKLHFNIEHYDVIIVIDYL
jgi:hypothetical protein